MTWALAPAGLVRGPSMLNTVRTPISRRAAMTCFIAVWSRGAYRKPIPTSSTHRATCCGVRSRLTPSVSTTSAEPQSDETERFPCLATRSPEPATTKAVAVETLNVPAASPPVPAVSISMSRSVPVRPATSSTRVRIRTAFWRITCAKPISSSTVSPFIRSAVRNAAIWAFVAAPDMIASIAAAASMRVRSRRSISVRTASVMMGLVMRPSVYLASSPAEVGALDPLVGHQALARPLEPDRAVLEDVGAVGEAQRPEHVLLDEEDRHTIAVDRGEVGEDGRDDDGRQPERRLVQHEQARARHQRAPDRGHLLLAARERPGELPAALGEPRKEREDPRERLRARAPALGRPRPQLEVLEHGHRGKELAAFRDVRDPARDDGRGPEPADPPAVELDRAAAERDQATDRAERRRLAGAVRADDRDDLAHAHLERDRPDGGHVAVAGLDPFKPEQRRHYRSPRGRLDPWVGWDGSGPASLSSPRYASITFGSLATASGRPSAIRSP